MPKIIKILLLLLICSCTNNTVFTKYKSVVSSKWHKDSIMNFTFNAKDTLSKNAIYINLRNNKNYEFKNIYLIASVQFPKSLKDQSQTTVTDTLQYKMADERGYFLGTGFTDVKENKLAYKTNIRFPIKGDYHFKIQHAIRKIGKENGVEFLNGVTDVGIEIEQIK